MMRRKSKRGKRQRGRSKRVEPVVTPVAASPASPPVAQRVALPPRANTSANLAMSNVTGNVTSNVTGNVTSNVTGNVTSNVTGNVTGSATPEALAARLARAELETSAGGIVYRVRDGEALFLLIRDSYRNWGFPKGHLEAGELPADAAVREVQEETGLMELTLAGEIETIDWFFRFRGKLVHKVCHFYLMRTEHARTVPQRAEGITACRWAPFDEATRLISYANARAVLTRAHAMVVRASDSAADSASDSADDSASDSADASSGAAIGQ